ncbi:MAG: acetyl/propionyl/methylcrotonyl-CoA carboxylase subunit alpha [Phenylobacterium sp.]|uniref:acetyl-CoA carboxylase biotin carboxylase subunit n=1 Tax=Phenylobacterium sp. TaxID=1871053 RepID=UPI00391CCA82
MNRVRRVLIANRGEIACRIARACRSLELESVAVFSEADRGALHVEAADFAEAIGPAPPAQSYLDVERILGAARRSGADAVHPGYGFLSENAAFAEAVLAAGLTWIGPSPACIRAMGDKLNARNAAEAAGVPVLPGRELRSAEPAELEAAISTIGFPALLKAAGGGGGMGMQVVETAVALAAGVPRLMDLARRNFAVPSVYLERLVRRARHVEVQVFGDGAGDAIHLFERDCSLQRRYQKIIEESPAPRLDPALRERLGLAAVRLARSQAYAGARTVEFLLDADTGDFFFLEMNTRIQVEHGVTEMVTGLDLVQMQIACAEGGLRLPSQAEVKIQGHAVECRLYAEDPARGFRPSPGLLETFTPPAGEGLRIESGYRSGDRISPFYDPMIAKIIAHGPTRTAAFQRMQGALQGLQVRGVATNLDFLRRLAAWPAILAGETDTRLAESLAAAPDGANASTETAR